MKTFEDNLKFGKLAESRIAKWLRKRGNTVIPAYELEGGNFKGPQVYTPDQELVAPDLLAWKAGNCFWVEAKRKSVFSWHRNTQKWVTGIDLHHYDHYQKVYANFGCSWEVWLLFLHESSEPWIEDRKHGCPPACPVGLYGDKLSELVFCENHRDPRWGKHGMVYWAKDNLKLLAKLSDL